MEGGVINAMKSTTDNAKTLLLKHVQNGQPDILCQKQTERDFLWALCQSFNSAGQDVGNQHDVSPFGNWKMQIVLECGEASQTNNTLLQLGSNL